MSVQATTAVIRDTRHKGSDLLVLLMLANHAGSEDWSCWPSVGLLAQETRLSERSVQYALRKLETSGEINAERGAGPYGTTMYRVLVGGANFAPPQSTTEGVQTSVPGGANQRTKGVQQAAPKPTTNHHEPSRTLALRATDELFEALFYAQTLTPYDPDAPPLTPGERSKINTATRDARAAGYEASDIQHAIWGWPKAMGDARITALGLMANMRRCLAAADGAQANVTKDELRERDQERVRREAFR